MERYVCIHGFISQPSSLCPICLGRFRKVAPIPGLAGALPFKIHLWKPQNIYYEMVQKLTPKLDTKTSGSEKEKEWFLHFSALGDKLRVRIPKTEGDARA